MWAGRPERWDQYKPRDTVGSKGLVSKYIYKKVGLFRKGVRKSGRYTVRRALGGVQPGASLVKAAREVCPRAPCAGLAPSPRCQEERAAQPARAPHVPTEDRRAGGRRTAPCAASN